MSAVVLRDVGIVCALGVGKQAVLEALLAGEAPGMREDVCFTAADTPAFHGHVDAPLPELGAQTAPRFRSRNNALLSAALDQIRTEVEACVARLGPARVAVVIGTSTSGIGETEAFFFGALGARERFHYGQMEVGSPSEFLSASLGLTGVAYTVSTACSSSAKALISARRLLRAGLCDAVLAGGVDSLCRMTHAGFAALGAVSPERCRPFTLDRKGINIGEGAALFLVTRDGAGPRLLGAGESSDAYHLSAPEPDGKGASRAMRGALEDAGLRPDQVGYVNAHGTATPQNDAMEALAIAQVLGTSVPVSSTKHLSGHTLGAAGALEAAFCWLLLGPDASGRLPTQPLLPGASWDPALPRLCFVQPGQQRDGTTAVMSTSFGFGGSNTALILGAGA